ncbi:MAG: hypothetical protein KDE27_09430 [Planctomycetes bacterium]|nr:hypothetical protein [Planctomycetota bacterium]
MSRYYQRLDAPQFDYELFEIDGLPHAFRGPAIDFDRPYVACIGAAQTFGRFAPTPFSALLAGALDIQVLNLAIGGSGPALYRKPDLLRLLQGAHLVVAQVLSGRSVGNSEFRTEGGVEGVALRTGERTRQEPLLAGFLRTEAPAFVERLVAETRANYVAEYRELFAAIGRPTVLFWFSVRRPDYVTGFGSMRELVGGFPQLVDGPTLSAVRGHASGYVECVSRRGLPQRLWPAATAVEGTRRGDDGCLYNDYYPTPAMHEDAAAALLPACRAALEAAPPPTPLPSPRQAGTAPAPRPTWFVIACAERTGSNLLVSLLRSHPAIGIAGELFNRRHWQDPIQWPPAAGRDDLVGLRDDPPALLSALGAMAAAADLGAFGFKLLYAQAELNPPVLAFLRGVPELRVIHLVRRNRLRRYLSLQRARLVDRWQRRTETGAVDAPPPPIDIDFGDCVRDFLRCREQERLTEREFADRRLLRLDYETLAADPRRVGDEVVRFLGLPAHPLQVGQQKTGTDPLHLAIGNYAELRAAFTAWLGHCDD